MGCGGSRPTAVALRALRVIPYLPALHPAAVGGDRCAAQVVLQQVVQRAAARAFVDELPICNMCPIRFYILGAAR